MDEIKIKVYGLLKVNRKQFLWCYACFGSVFLFLTIFFIFYKLQIPEDIGKLELFFYKNSSFLWFFFFLWLIIEGQFYWTKFVKCQLQIIENQKNEIVRQRDLLNVKNKEITDSINYASRIQKTLLPDEEIFAKSLDDNFVFFRPRDIVRGDFYWINEIDDKTNCSCR